MENVRFSPSGVCAVQIEFDVEDGKLHNVKFLGGCNGNLKAIGKLVEGKPAEDIQILLEGNTCGFNSTSCADQLSKAIKAAMEGSL